jgi:ketosteroid isomerase-like protein
MSWGREFLTRFLEQLQRQDIDEFMESYHEDAELVAFNFVLKGKHAIRQYFVENMFKKMGKILDMNDEAYFESDDTILFTLSINAENLGAAIARDALYLNNGKIFRHIALSLPPEKDIRMCKGLK